jgi:hypothetical protein
MATFSSPFVIVKRKLRYKTFIRVLVAMSKAAEIEEEQVHFRNVIAAFRNYSRHSVCSFERSGGGSSP